MACVGDFHPRKGQTSGLAFPLTYSLEVTSSILEQLAFRATFETPIHLIIVKHPQRLLRLFSPRSKRTSTSHLTRLSSPIFFTNSSLRNFHRESWRQRVGLCPFHDQRAWIWISSVFASAAESSMSYLHSTLLFPLVVSETFRR